MVAALAVLSMSLAMAPLPSPDSCTALEDAVKHGDADAVQRLAGRRLLGMGTPAAQLEERGREPGACSGRTALMFAAELGQVASAQILISSGANLSATAVIPELGDAEFDARCLAIANNQEELVTLLDKAGAIERGCNEDARLFGAIHARDRTLIERQLRAHPSKATILAALNMGVQARGPKMLDLLVQAGLEVKLDFASVYSAAVTAGDVEKVNQLSSGGAKIKGGYALSLAIGLHQAGAIPSLLAAGARTDSVEAREAILEAVRDQQGPALRALLAAGYRGDDATPLLLHAVRYFPSLVREMVKAGVSVELDDEAGATPLMAAAASNDTNLVQLLIERGASPRTGDILCDTAFDAARAPKKAQPAMMQRLLPPLEQPVVPGRAARKMGITCGAARLSISIDPDFEVYLPTGQLPMRPAMEDRVEPGIHELRVRQLSTGLERKMRVSLSPGLNSYSENFFDFSRKRSQPEAPEAADPRVMLRALNSAHILEVISQNKVGLQKCVVEQHRRAPKLGGKLLMRWKINTDGETSSVGCITPQFESTYLAECLQTRIEEWKFPEHLLEGEPVEFPFKF